MAKIRFRLNKGLIEEELKELKDKGQIIDSTNNQ